MLPIFRRLLCPFDHTSRDPTHTCTVHAITTLCHTIFQLIQKDDSPLPLFNDDPHSLRSHFWMALKLFRQTMIMRSKESQTSNMAGKMPKHGLRHAYSITTTRASPQLI